jgi:hypothetical protein
MCKLMFGVGMLDRVCVFREMYGEGKEEKAKRRRQRGERKSPCVGFIGHVSTSVCTYTTT